MNTGRQYTEITKVVSTPQSVEFSFAPQGSLPYTAPIVCHVEVKRDGVHLSFSNIIGKKVTVSSIASNHAQVKLVSDE